MQCSKKEKYMNLVKDMKINYRSVMNDIGIDKKQKQ